MGPEMASASENVYKIPVFNGSNFNNWLFRINSILDERELSIFVTKDAEEILKDSTHADSSEEVKNGVRRNEKKCKSLIIQSIADSHLEYIKDKTTPKEIINTLKFVFERKSISNQLFLRKKLLTLKLNETDSLENHFLYFDQLVRELKSTGAKLEENDVICHLLLTLPESYNSVVTSIETVLTDPSKQSLDFVKSRLLDESIKRRNDHTTFDDYRSAFAGKYKSSRIKCYSCGRLGHRQADCRYRNQRNENRRNESAHFGSDPSDAPDDLVFLANDPEDESHVSQNLNWFIDSGATDHMVKDRHLFASFRTLEHPIEISVAKNGYTIIATGIGDIKIIAKVYGTFLHYTVKDVLYIPVLKCNLFSVSKVEKQGKTITFNDGTVKIFDNNKLVATGSRFGKLYKMNFLLDETAALSVSNNSDIDLWHRRYGHLNENHLKKLSSQDMVIGLPSFGNELKTICEGCLQGKQTRLPFRNCVDKRTTRPLERIHTDVWGPVTPCSWDGKRYYVSFIDDYTHFTIVYLMKEKLEVFEKFRDYEARVTAHVGQRVSILRCDNGGEYLSKNLKDFCRHKGIHIEYTVPYSPEQNGVAERMNRTLLDKARSMIHGQGLAKYLWGEAVLTAVYLTNRSPTSSLKNEMKNLTPAEMWYRKKPDISKLRIFGAIAHVHVPKEKRGKLDSKSMKTIMVGYGNNGYRLWNEEKRQLIIARDVIFEEIFEKESKQPSNTAAAKEWIPAKNGDDHYEQGSSHIRLENQTVELNENISIDNVSNENESGLDGVVEDQDTVEGIIDTADTEQYADDRQLRNARERKRPTWHEDFDMSYMALNAENFVEDIPINFEDIARRPDKDLWMKAIQEEVDALHKNSTWELTDLPPGRRAIQSKWVFKIKRNEENSIEKYKARLVAKGCSQRPGFDFNETYAPVVKLTTVRIVLALAVRFDLHIHQMDVKTAFLNGTIREEIYMKLPSGFKSNEQKVCKLKKSLYGLKQAPRMWNEEFDQYIKKFQFHRCESDYCLYVKIQQTFRFYLVLFVDDLLLVSDSIEEIDKMKTILSKKFEMTDMKEVKYFLGFLVEKQSGKLKISQKSYIEKVLLRFGMVECKIANTPMESNLKLVVSDAMPVTSKPYKELIGCLMFIMTISRPDISAAVNYFSRMQAAPTDQHWVYLKRVVRYLKGTINLKLVFNKEVDVPVLEGYADSDWGTDVNDRKSTSGFVFKLFGSPVSWSTRKQPTVSLSSTEAEYIALCNAVCECLWIQSILKEMNIDNSIPGIIYEDNQACLSIARNPKQHQRMKHIDIKYNFIRNVVQEEKVHLEYIETRNQLADIFTKGLSRIQFGRLRERLNLETI